MACVAHDCHDCDYGWEDNRRGGSCPQCGSDNITNHFDEDNIMALEYPFATSVPTLEDDFYDDDDNVNEEGDEDDEQASAVSKMRADLAELGDYYED